MNRKPALLIASLCVAALLPAAHAAEIAAAATAAPFTRDAGLLSRADALLAAAGQALGGNGNGNGTSTGHRPDAARAVARYVILARLFPDGEPAFTMDLARAVADMPEDDAKAAAMAEGRRIAERVLARYGF